MGITTVIITIMIPTLIRNKNFTQKRPMTLNNIGYACTGEQCEAGLGDKLAFRFVKLDGVVEELTYAMLEQETNQIADSF